MGSTHFGIFRSVGPPHLASGRLGLWDGLAQGMWVLAGGGPSSVAGSSLFPSWLSHFLFGERGGGSCLGGGPQS